VTAWFLDWSGTTPGNDDDIAERDSICQLRTGPLPIPADYERHRNCVGSARACTPIVLFCARNRWTNFRTAACECAVRYQSGTLPAVNEGCLARTAALLRERNVIDAEPAWLIQRPIRGLA
jgi:hypothetical protein